MSATRRSPWFVIAVLALGTGLVLSGLATYAVFTTTSKIGAGLRARLPLVHGVLVGSLLVQLVALGWTLRTRHVRVPSRVLMYVLVAATVAFLGFLQPFWKLYFDITTCLAFGAFAGLVLVGPWLGHWLPNRALRLLDLVCFNLCALVLLAEFGLRTFQAFRPTPLLTQVDSSMLDRLDRYRLRPGELHMGFPANGKGYYDDRREPKKPGETLVASIGDSFSIGVVPHALHFTTVAERALRDVRIDNIGAGGIGPSEYIHLLKHDALPLHPDAVVVCLFVGNDVVEAGKARVAHRTLRRFFDRGNILLYLLPRRLARLAGERKFREGTLGSVQGQNAARATTKAEIAAHFPWVYDPLLEQGTFSKARFLAIELERVRGVQDWNARKAYPKLAADIRELQQLCGSTPLLFLLIPDEYQVEDELWDELTMADDTEPVLRDIAQREIRARLDAAKLPYVDLLPKLRRVPKLSDGKRHVYHLRDTHFNTRGNAVAGKALAKALADLLHVQRRVR